jgi:hypothetical protein
LVPSRIGTITSFCTATVAVGCARADAVKRKARRNGEVLGIEGEQGKAKAGVCEIAQSTSC